MDETGYSIVAQVAAKAATEIYVTWVTTGQLPPGGFNADAWDTAYKHIGKSIIGSTHRALQAERGGPQPGDPDPFVPHSAMPPAAVPPPPPVAPQQPAAPSQPVGQPSPVMGGPPCPNCNTPMSMTNDYAAKKARNLASGKKAPPMWKCPMGSYDPVTRQALGCQGAGWETAA